MTETVSLKPFTPEMYHAYYREYRNDPELYIDKSQCKPFVYSPEWVDRYIRRQTELNRRCFAIMHGGEMVGEVILKNIEPGKSAALGICMKNDACKNRGFGTRAERLAIDYVFRQLDIPVLYADSIRTNTRSQHVLEKVGFCLLREEGDFKYYRIDRPEAPERQKLDSPERQSVPSERESVLPEQREPGSEPAPRTLLITAFEPFGGEAVNASMLAVEALPDRIGPWRLHKAVLPVEFGRAGERAAALAEELGAEAVVCVGQAAGRESVTPELAALNLQYARIPDNAGRTPLDQPVVPGAREAYFSTLPVRAMAEAIRAAGLPGALSCSAGLYVCNDLYYRLLHHFHGTGVRVAFLHVPAVSGRPCLDTPAAARALELAIGQIP